MENAMDSESDEADFSIQDKMTGQALPRDEAERVIGRMEELESKHPEKS
jgi:hypothetical protein